ncbi:hypothetical protein BFR57_02515 [Idiomarina sp. MD25a]|uniref:hypothetical protein n=1 Tax=Idiomarina sp. MD25a TaxID=1889913 RepID=UPI0008F8FCA1|nr:hypothetical protein [Idiomarina sp. MD25a]OIM99458.1 hypothetical protein BFR57_02515 [Idiomarina sp. MD25a]
MKICFFGTSFLGALQLGYRHFTSLKNVTCDFYGVNAPALLRDFKDGKVVREKNVVSFLGHMPVFIKRQDTKNAESSNRTFKGMSRESNLSIDLSTYDAVVLVDMFYRFPLLNAFDFHKNGSISCQGTLISEGMLSEFHINGLCGFELNSHLEFGTVEYTASEQLVQLFKHENLYVCPAPKAPHTNISDKLEDIGVSVDHVCNVVEQIFLHDIRKMGARLITQEPETEHSRYSTRPEFSRGPHKKIDNYLDPHMNEEFGRLQLQRILNVVLSA